MQRPLRLERLARIGDDRLAGGAGRCVQAQQIDAALGQFSRPSAHRLLHRPAIVGGQPRDTGPCVDRQVLDADHRPAGFRVGQQQLPAIGREGGFGRPDALATGQHHHAEDGNRRRCPFAAHALRPARRPAPAGDSPSDRGTAPSGVRPWPTLPRHS